MNLPLGISVQPSFLHNGLQVIVDYDHEHKLAYWSGHDKGWVSYIGDAKTWPAPKPGEIPYAENNAYSLWNDYQKGPYKIVALSAGLYPCTIKRYDLYLLDMRPREKYWFNPSIPELITNWTNNYGDAKRFMGPPEVVPAFFEIVKKSRS